MARTLNAAVHTVRKEAFVDVAQRLMQTKGYEQMSVQDVLDELGASRGAFYHYFDSKQALLEAVVDRMVDGALAAVSPIVDDPNLSALRKFEGVFAGIQRFKAGHHGPTHTLGAMIGYVQEETTGFWNNRIANWIGDLVASGQRRPTG